ncbi:hypothetical protein D3OALGA1CA_3948 [Olavius algarvensis associated proteobacterium Delta 3]|nr:hypothetical protein D3OALGB2SA_1750 [Olavius algarvensis associated proteobacterium Delta 3]CAB5142670.1 hypothetical protein D3OALGA1CA_3948 [Olavius algarvensis associated proteobacterium Delta 3]
MRLFCFQQMSEFCSCCRIVYNNKSRRIIGIGIGFGIGIDLEDSRPSRFLLRLR